MNKIEDIRRINLWEGVSPANMWETYKSWQDNQFYAVFAPERQRAIARIRNYQDEKSNNI